MTHQPHDDDDLDTLHPTMPRRRVLQSLVGATLTLVGLAGCGGEEEDEDEGGEENEAEEDD